MTDSQRRLADGIAAVVRAWLRGDELHTSSGRVCRGLFKNRVITQLVTEFEVSEPPNPPPLSPLQSLALSVLVSQTAESGAMLIDALKEVGLIGDDYEAMIRADEREKAAKVCDAADAKLIQVADLYRGRGYDFLATHREQQAAGARVLAGKIRRGATS